MRILVIEDDRKIARFLTRGLEAEGHVVEVVHDGHDALKRARAGGHDLVLLDLMLPGADGFEILRQLRLVDTTTPLFIMSARDAVEDRVRGLDLGADDYISKPFSFVELQARLRAFFRRERGRAEEPRKRVGRLELDRVSRTVDCDGSSVSLTTRECQLLDYFMSNPDQPLTRSMLADRVWGYQFDTGTNVVDVYVNYVRKKLAKIGVDPVRTLRGVGYVFATDLASEESP